MRPGHKDNCLCCSCKSKRGDPYNPVGQPRSLEIRVKISTRRLGHLVSDVTRKKIGDANRGHHHSPETCKQMSETHKRLEHHPPALKGENHPNWRGGSSDYPTAWTEELKEAIRKRDHHTCQMCNKIQEEFPKKLDVHHIDYDKKKLDPKNLISLCHSCHAITTNRRERGIPFSRTTI